MAKNDEHTYRIRDKRASSSEGGAAVREDAYDGSVDARPARIAAEVERQRAIYRIGTSDAILQRAAINALMERGEY